MNERIRELAEQCYEEGTKTWYGDGGMSGVDWVFNEEKFAEMIVKDCRDMFMVGSVSWNLLNEKLEHLGVEE